jgi:A/G-specific adenine glycosylase
LAKKEDLERLIKCLGLSRQRSKQLIKMANLIMEQHGGLLPKTYDELIKLPGVGMYTTGGALCLVYNRDVSMVDTNVVRVVTRYFNFKSTKTESWTDKKLWKFVKDLIPKGKCREFNLGLIDFANAICVPKKPKCEICGLTSECYFFQTFIR